MVAQTVLAVPDISISVPDSRASFACYRPSPRWGEGERMRGKGVEKLDEAILDAVRNQAIKKEFKFKE